MDEAGEGIESLIDAVIDGRCDEAGLLRLEAMVRDDPRARAAYLDQMRMHVLLEWRHGRVSPQSDRAEAGPGRLRWLTGRRARWMLAAAALVAALLVARPFLAGRREVATLVESRGLVWDGPGPASARLAPGRLRCAAGTLRLAFDSGASVTVEGPADLEILSGKELGASRGRITARMEGSAQGFTIATPTARVVDQGTEFGVEVDESGKTGVVVFRGLVDLTSQGRPDRPAAVTRLAQGEALRVDGAGQPSRIVAVERRPGDDEWSTGPTSDQDAVIRSVGDNLRGLDSSKYYQIVHRGLADDAPAYVDRPHEWNGLDSSGLPGFLRGADYIMPFNDDKWLSDLEITVELAQEATLYVFLDHRETPPAWLTAAFTRTGVDIGLDEGSWPDPTLYGVGRGPGRSIDHIFSVWSREAGRDESIRLGSLRGGRNNRAMYGIAAVARPAPPPASRD